MSVVRVEVVQISPGGPERDINREELGAEFPVLSSSHSGLVSMMLVFSLSIITQIVLLGNMSAVNYSQSNTPYFYFNVMSLAVMRFLLTL